MATMEDLIATISGSHVGQDGYDLQVLQAHLAKTLAYAHYPRLPLTPSQTYHDPTPTNLSQPQPHPSFHTQNQSNGFSAVNPKAGGGGGSDYRPVQITSHIPVAPVSSLNGVGEGYMSGREGNDGTGQEYGSWTDRGEGNGPGQGQQQVGWGNGYNSNGGGGSNGYPIAGPGPSSSMTAGGYAIRPRCTPASSYRGLPTEVPGQGFSTGRTGPSGGDVNGMNLGDDSSEGEGEDEDMMMDDGFDEGDRGRYASAPFGTSGSSVRSSSSMETDYGAFDSDAFAPLQTTSADGGPEHPYGQAQSQPMEFDPSRSSGFASGMETETAQSPTTTTKNPWDAFRKSSTGSGNNVWGGQTPTWGAGTGGTSGGATPHGSAGAGLAASGLVMSMAMSPKRYVGGGGGGMDEASVDAMSDGFGRGQGGASPFGSESGSPFAGGQLQQMTGMSAPGDDPGGAGTSNWNGRLRSSRRNA